MIKGKKIGIRAIEKVDLKQLRDWRNLESFRRNFREVKELNLANQESWFESYCVDNPYNFMFAIIQLDNNKLIGAGGLLYINWINRSADFSLYIGENEEYIQEKGYANESTLLLLKYGFNNLNLHKIWMELYEYDSLKLDFFQNIYSFKIDGKLRDNCFEDGKYYNSYILSLLENEFNE